jgi:LysM repeat protein
MYNTILIKSHENNCPKIPLSDIVKDMADELPSDVPREQLTEQDMRDFFIKKNLVSSYDKILPHPTPGEGGFTNHVITDTDTLSGIALRYGITVEDLRKANRLVGNGSQALYQHTVLRVPVATKPQQNNNLDLASINLLKKRLVARFARKTGSNNLDEAQYYLEAHNFDFDAAYAEFIKDVQVPLPTPPKTISTHVPSRHAAISTAIKPNRSCCFSLA